MAQGFNARAGGAYEMKVYAGEALAKMQEGIDLVGAGAIEMGNHPLDLLGGQEKMFNAVALPWLYNNIYANQAAYIQTEEIYDKIMMNKFNQKVVTFHCYGGLEITSRKPIRTLEDWEGLLVMATSPVSAGIAESLGASSVSIPWPEMYSTMEKGIADCLFTGITPVLSMNMFEVCDYEIISYALGSLTATCVNLDVWNDMPKDIQDIMLDEAKAFLQRENEFNQNGQIEIPKALAEKGMDVYHLPKEERDRWKQAVKPFFDQMVADLGPDCEKIVAIAEEANKAHP
jgi:TRAP-type C4-dicarboxylate transport system substrate-binding protein